jgi:hypothetical protein
MRRGGVLYIASFGWLTLSLLYVTSQSLDLSLADVRLRYDGLDLRSLPPSVMAVFPQRPNANAAANSTGAYSIPLDTSHAATQEAIAAMQVRKGTVLRCLESVV